MNVLDEIIAEVECATVKFPTWPTDPLHALAVATLPSGEEQLTLHTGLPVAISQASLNRCAWLELVRLDSDDFNLHWIAWDCLRVSLPIVVLP